MIGDIPIISEGTPIRTRKTEFSLLVGFVNISPDELR